MQLYPGVIKGVCPQQGTVAFLGFRFQVWAQAMFMELGFPRVHLLDG